MYKFNSSYYTTVCKATRAVIKPVKEFSGVHADWLTFFDIFCWHGQTCLAFTHHILLACTQMLADMFDILTFCWHLVGLLAGKVS